MLERVRENSPISASICLARAQQGPRQSQGTFTQSKMTNQDSGNASVFGSEPRAPGGPHGVLRRPRLQSVKVWGSEEPGARAEEGAGFSDLSKGHLRACCSCHSPRAVPRGLTGRAQARPSRRPPPPASPDRLYGVRRGVCAQARGGGVKSGSAPMCLCPSRATARLWHLLPHPIHSSPASVLYTEVDF